MEKQNMAAILSLINSVDGKRLIETLKKDGGTAFYEAATAAKNGKYQEAKSILEPLLGEEAEKLAQSLANQNG